MRAFEAMCHELHIAGWTATQGNRSSISSEVVTTDQMGGSIKKAQVGHVIISVAKTLQQKELYAKYESLDEQQIREFVDAYAERCIDDMDMKCLMQFVFDTITENLNIQEPQQILEEVFCVYDEETVAELINSVTPD